MLSVWTRSIAYIATLVQPSSLPHKKDQVLSVLEAMKMENRSLCPVSGKKVKVIKVVKGQSVMTDEILLIFE